MRKKIVVLLCVVALLASSAIMAYANEIMPLYNEITAVQSTMGIDGNVLHYTVKVLTPDFDTLDSVHINAKLKTISGVTKATYNEDLTKIGPIFNFSKEKTVTSEDTYFLEYTVKCYKNNVLVDEVSKTTVTATYSG
ncbi:MAG: hypothetical protein ACI4U1_05595 [Anaerovoracaceae bacterium]